MSDFKQFYASKTTWFFEHVIFAGIPVCLAVIQFASRPFFHYGLMLLVVAYMSVIAFVVGVKFKELGFSFTGVGRHIVEFAPETLLLCALILLGKFVGFIHPVVSGDTLHVFFYVLISVPLQELVFRSFCVWRCSLSWRSNLFIILFTSANFAFYHSMYGNWQLVVGVFFINLYWALLYMKQRDVVVVALSHAAIGVAYFI